MRTRFLLALIVTISIIVVVASIFAGKNQKTSAENLTKDVMPGFTEINSVQGVSFFVNSKFTDKATAVTQVSDNVSFQKNQYYSYKNGNDKYLLFNMEQLVVVAQKGTDFWIGESNEKEQALLDASMLNIWFQKGSKKFESETENGVTKTTAIAGVAINSTTYGDFCGKLANINRDGEEWSLFVGVPGERYDKLSDSSREGIETIINTFSFSEGSNLLDKNIYAISVEGDSQKTKVDTVEEVFEFVDSSLNLTNQKTIADKENDKAYTSSPYNMLSIGDNGLLSTFSDYLLRYEDAIICPTAVLRGEEAENLIKEFCNATGQYEYSECPPGSQWEVVEYDLNYAHCTYSNYVNIELRGVDGEELRYRGIKYSARTYDMTFMVYEDGNWERKYYSYYAIPNGCYEYCLMAGEDSSVTKQEVNAAYYHIFNKNEAVHSEQNIDINEKTQSSENTASEQNNSSNELAITSDYE